MIRHPDRLLTAILVLLLLWAPLPFGSASPGGLAALEVAAFLALAFGLLAAGEGWSRALARVAVPLAAVAGVAVLGFLQSLPWPAASVARLSPEHARLFATAAEILAPLGRPVSTSLSLAPAMSRFAALAWAAAGAALAAAAVAGADRRRRRALGAALVAGALFQVLHGARAWFAESTTIWGLEVPGGGGRLRGSFVNPDHLALYLGMALPAVFAWGWWAARRARDETQVDRRVLLLAPPALLWLTLFTGLAFTGSRAGLVAGVTTAVVQGALFATSRRQWRLAPIGAAAAVVGIGVVASVGLQQGLGRLLSTNPYDVSWGARKEAYAATLKLWRRFPATGSGLGSYREAFTLVQPTDLDSTWRHAHCDPLELLATGGAVAAILVALGLAALAVRLAGVLRDGRRSEDRAAGLAALGALAAVAVHESLDFGLTIPANAFVLAIVLGAAAAAKREPAAVSVRREPRGRQASAGLARRARRSEPQDNVAADAAGEA